MEFIVNEFDKITGNFAEWYPNSETLRIRARLLNNELHGNYYEYYEDPPNQMYMMSVFRKGQRHGLREIYYPNGHLQTRMEYANDKISGPVYFYHENHNAMIQCTFNEFGFLTGTFTSTDENNNSVVDSYSVNGDLLQSRTPGNKPVFTANFHKFKNYLLRHHIKNRAAHRRQELAITNYEKSVHTPRGAITYPNYVSTYEADLQKALEASRQQQSQPSVQDMINMYYTEQKEKYEKAPNDVQQWQDVCSGWLGLETKIINSV